MAKPYSIFKAPTGVYYVQIRLPDGTRSNKKSTGSYVCSEAEKIVMGWVVNGSLSQRTNGKKQDEVTSVGKVTYFNNLKTFDFSSSDVDEIISILKKRKMIVSAVITKTPESRLLEDFVDELWDMEKSPYIREKKIKEQGIHLQHVLFPAVLECAREKLQD